MSSQVVKVSGGMSGATMLGIVFVTLKLCGVIDWSWLWVLAPFWVGAVFVLAVVSMLFVVFSCATVVAWTAERRERERAAQRLEAVRKRWGGGA